MPTIQLTSRLTALLEYLDGLTARASVDTLKRLLLEVDVSVEDLADYAQFHETHYRRNLVKGGEWYHLLIICWRSGQRSPIHNHAQSICGLKVLTGVATETIFERSPCGLMKAVVSRDCPAGSICVSEDSDTHQVSNLQPAGVDLATLHIYAPPLTRMETYSITDGWVGEYAPQ